MSTLSTEQGRHGYTGEGEEGRRNIELRLTQLQQEDYVMPGWQTAWSDIDNCVMIMFQPVHQGMPEAMTEFEFRMWLRGWDARRAAVMARRPRQETVHTHR